jgi:Putative glycolipid-binding
LDAFELERLLPGLTGFLDGVSGQLEQDLTREVVVLRVQRREPLSQLTEVQVASDTRQRHPDRRGPILSLLVKRRVGGDHATDGEFGGDFLADAPAALVRALGFDVERPEQRYERIADDGTQQRFDYTAPVLDYGGRLVYDASGLVLDYPAIAIRDL